ncbi:MAG: hypothetical protein JWO80_4963 [Bryobacterales bacterium]|nr:hypothetical protein [Bryobacterales bacterium]
MAATLAVFRTRNLPDLTRLRRLRPDGRRLAYAACATGDICDIYVVELGPDYSPRSTPLQITRQGALIRGLTWTHDGRALIYSLSGASALMTYLWRTGIDGRQSPQRLDIAGPLANSPSASPTANRVVFHRSIFDPDIWSYYMNRGTEPVIASSFAIDDNPQFSPDGTKIAFESGRSADLQEIWVVQADGSKPVQLTNRVGRHQGTPRWSPDGRWIAFDSQGRDGQWGIYVMDVVGTGLRRVTSGPSNNSMPFWSRDGKWLYFRSDRTGRPEIWRLRFTGGSQEQVTTNGGYTAYESVDGQTLFYTKQFIGPLFTRPLIGGAERQVLPYIIFKAFFPVAAGIYYIGRRNNEKYFSLEFLQFSDNTSRLLAKIDGAPYQGLSVSSDEKTLLFSKSATVGADLMMIENFR